MRGPRVRVLVQHDCEARIPLSSHMLRRTFAGVRNSLARWLGVQVAEVYEVRGFRVVVENSRPDISTGDVLARLDEALALIERYMPWRMRHMRRDLRDFWVVRYPCRGAYLYAERRCMTELTFLARRDITAATIASSILHEGMHARMYEMGVRVHEASSARMERICRRAELDFGYALPLALGAPVIERALATIDLDDADVSPDIDWEEAMRRVQSADRAASADPAAPPDDTHGRP